jgi:hypothetical protein
MDRIIPEEWEEERFEAHLIASHTGESDAARREGDRKL